MADRDDSLPVSSSLVTRNVTRPGSPSGLSCSARTASMASASPAFMSYTPGPEEPAVIFAPWLPRQFAHRPHRVVVAEQQNLAFAAAELGE